MNVSVQPTTFDISRQFWCHGIAEQKIHVSIPLSMSNHSVTVRCSSDNMAFQIEDKMVKTKQKMKLFSAHMPNPKQK